MTSSNGDHEHDNFALNLPSDVGPEYPSETDIELGYREPTKEDISSENGLCCICSDDSCLIIKCSGSNNPHGLCLECFQGYANLALN